MNYQYAKYCEICSQNDEKPLDKHEWAEQEARKEETI